MGTYTEFLEEYLQGSRCINRKIYKVMNGAYRAIQNKRITLESFCEILENKRKEKNNERSSILVL